MLKTELYISQLLYDFNCVILPGFGGFVCNWNSATINNVSHTFSPPFKNIIFNKNLVNNDGLLTGKISEELDISFAEANQLLSNYIEDLKLKLSVYKRIDLENIGVIYLDEEKNIQFIQNKNLNYLKDAYGLGQYKVKPITVTGQPQVTFVKEPEFIDRPQIAQTISPVLNSRKRLKRLAYIAVPVLLLAISIPIGIKKNNPNLNMAGVFSFLSAENNFTTAHPTINKIAETININNQKNVEGLKFKIDSLVQARISLAADTTNVTSTVSEQLISNTNFNNYFLVAGCFANKENAVKLVLSLKEKGFDAQIIDEVGGLTRVAYKSFPNKTEAFAALSQIKSENPGVWVLKK